MARLLTAGDEQLTWKFLVYGRSGTGKTSLGVSAPKPLIALSEFQGFAHVQKEAKRRGVPVPPTVFIESVDDMRKMVIALRADKPMEAVYDAFGFKEKPPWPRPETLVNDSATELFELFGDEINRQAPPKVGPDGLPQPADRYWNTLIDRINRFVRSVRDLPYHVLFLCLEQERGKTEQDIAIGPMVPTKKMPETLAAAVNAVGRTEVIQRPTDEGRDVDLVYRVRFAGPSTYQTKPCPPLRMVEEPDVAKWIETLTAHVGNSKED